MLKLLCLCAALGWVEPPPDSILDLLKSPTSPALASSQRPDSPALWLAEAIEQAGWECGRFQEHNGRYLASTNLAGREIAASYQPERRSLRLTCLLASIDNSEFERHLDHANAWTQKGRTTRMFVDQNRRVVLRADLKSADKSNLKRVVALLEGFAADLRLCARNYPVLLTSPADQAPASPQAQRDHDLGKQLFLATRNDPVQSARAVALLERAVLAAPNKDVFKIDLADAYVQMGHELSLAFATDYYEDVLQRRPDNPQLLARLSEAYHQLGNKQAALDYASRRLAVTGSRDRYMAALQLASVAMQTGQHAAGVQALEEHLKLDPNQHGVRLLLATVQAEAGNTTRAIELIRQVQGKLKPASPLYETANKMLARIQP